MTDDEQLYEMIEELCKSKAEEFHFIGYEQVTSKDIWDCVSSGYAKKGLPELHRLVNDILSLKPTKFMNYLTISAYKGDLFN